MLAALIRRASRLVLLVALSFTSVAYARDHESLASENRAAMEAYEQRDIRKAKGILRKALRRAKRKGVDGKELATVYANLGIVTAAGSNSLNRAVRSFRRALKEDPSIKPDRKYASPEAMAAFQAAIRANESGHADLGDDDEEEDDEDPPAATRGRREVELKDPDELEAEARESGAAQKPALPPFKEVVKEPAPGPRAAAAQGGCSVDGDCGWGATCRNGTCAPVSDTAAPEESAEAERTSEADSTNGGRHGFFGELGFGAGVTSLTKGRAPDRLPDRTFLNGAVNLATDPNTGMVDEADVERNLRIGGWDCSVDYGGVNGPSANDCSVAADPVLVAEPVLDVAVGYYLTPRLGLALTTLLELRRGVGPMAGVLVGARLEYLVSTPTDEGLQVSLVVGGGVGALHVRPKDSPQGGPRATNTGVGTIGYAASAGLKALYRTDPHWAFGVTPLLHVGLPNVLVLVALTAGVEANF